ncbi:glutathione peroxidase [Paenibacillus aurantius]|uniref:Glutathione peroxidase n=1 Tax=Paenibacillus aurantius TaxID=2918900 RepID=A0AA96LC98_9BACL|nr:glutathione peroxidase [Paenibacillus aurantius]WNQ11077.1 glutathione peroxidase [Paenibacillus aurantius]
MGVYDYKAVSLKGDEVSLDAYRGKALLIVNTASKCGFTPQYSGLQELYEKYKDQGLEILGFPCNQFGGQEPGGREEIEDFCQVNYGVTFPMFEKIEVLGENKHPLFAYLTEEAPFEGFDVSTPGGGKMQGMFEQRMPEALKTNDIKWNFTKFLVDRKGNVVKRFESPVTPAELEPAIENVL